MHIDEQNNTELAWTADLALGVSYLIWMTATPAMKRAVEVDAGLEQFKFDGVVAQIGQVAKRCSAASRHSRAQG